MSTCICHLVLPNPTSVHQSALECSLCNRSLFKTALVNAMDTLTVLNEKLINEKNSRELLQQENEQLQHDLATLRATVNLMKSDNDVLAKKLIAETEQRTLLIVEVSQPLFHF